MRKTFLNGKAPFFTLFFCVVLFFTLALPIGAQLSEYEIPAGHRGRINSLVRDPQGRILSAGEDGFLNIWDADRAAALERFQLSRRGIVSMVLRPGKTEIALLENDGTGLSRISAWDYLRKEKIFTLPFRGAVDFISYSGAGNFILAGTDSGVRFLRSDTGAEIPVLADLDGKVSFAATGRSEKTLLCYMPPGVLSYWDIETGEEIRHFNVPSGISSPALFGNNRFFAGFDSEGLLIVDAVSGTILLRENGVREGKLITVAASDPESTEFVCIEGGASGTLYHFSINPSGKLETRNRRQAPASLANISAASILSEDSIVLGTAGGEVFIYSGRGSSKLLGTSRQRLIREAAVSSSVLAFVTEDSRLGFIPLDYTKLNSDTTINLQNSALYNSISSDPKGGPVFLLWQDEKNGGFPMIKNLMSPPQDGITEDAYVDSVSFRFPLRSVSVRAGNILFLDSVGNISVIDQQTGNAKFNYVSTGSQDALLSDSATILIGRSTGNVPFFTVNMLTGETVPLSLPAALGLKVYRGPSGTIYGGAVSRSGNDFLTSLFSINMNSPSQSRKLAEYPGEDTRFTMAESGSFLVSSLGDGEAFLYRVSGNGNPKLPLERGAGLPEFILEGGNRFFIVVDTDGNISWHDNRNGRTLARFKLGWNEWTLEGDDASARGRVSG